MDTEASDFNVTDEEEFARYASISATATSTPPTKERSALLVPAVSAHSVTTDAGSHGKRNRSSGLGFDFDRDQNNPSMAETPGKRLCTASIKEAPEDLASLIRNQTKLILTQNSEAMQKLDEIKATAEGARTSADAAKMAVEEVRSLAYEAKSTADGAMDAAEIAKATADAAIAAATLIGNRANARIDVLEDRLERVKRSADLLLNGVPLGGKETHQELREIVAKLTTAVGVGVGADDVEAVRVIPGTKIVLVKFATSHLRRKFFHAYMAMGGLTAREVGYVGDERIFVSDNLTSHNSHMRFLASGLVKAGKLASCTVREGIVYVKVAAGDTRKTPIFIKEDLDNLVSQVDMPGAGQVPVDAGRQVQATGRSANQAPRGKKARSHTGDRPQPAAAVNRGRGRGQSHAQKRQ